MPPGIDQERSVIAFRMRIEYECEVVGSCTLYLQGHQFVHDIAVMSFAESDLVPFLITAAF